MLQTNKQSSPLTLRIRHVPTLHYQRIKKKLRCYLRHHELCMTQGSNRGYQSKLAKKIYRADWACFLCDWNAPLGGSILPCFGRCCCWRQSNEWIERKSERDMTLWWTANLLGAQRDIADCLNANPPPGEENSDNNASVCVSVTLSLSMCLPVREIWGVINHANMWPAVQQRQGLVHPSLQVCPMCLIPAHSCSWNPGNIFLTD